MTVRRSATVAWKQVLVHDRFWLGSRPYRFSSMSFEWLVPSLVRLTYYPNRKKPWFRCYMVDNFDVLQGVPCTPTHHGEW